MAHESIGLREATKDLLGEHVQKPTPVDLGELMGCGPPPTLPLQLSNGSPSARAQEIIEPASLMSQCNRCLVPARNEWSTQPAAV
jgi:hypothetical protein